VSDKIAASALPALPARPVQVRKYDSPTRRRRAEETRERILAAGATLLHRSSIRDWRSLTVRGVAEHAGVNERTVYRYFGSERGLRDAVMHRLEEQAGIELEGMGVDDAADIAARIFEHVSAYPRRPKPSLDPTLADAGLRQRQALCRAVDERAPAWSDEDKKAAAALLDVLWNVGTYEHLVADWGMDTRSASRAVAWAMDLVADALAAGRRPAPQASARSTGP
jgi:AcrR family transcriptional regulator